MEKNYLWDVVFLYLLVVVVGYGSVGLYWLILKWIDRKK